MFKLGRFTWPLSGRSVRRNRLARAGSSVRLLLRQQHTLIHRSCEIVYMAAAADRREGTHTPTVSTNGSVYIRQKMLYQKTFKN